MSRYKRAKDQYAIEIVKNLLQDKTLMRALGSHPAFELANVAKNDRLFRARLKTGYLSAADHEQYINPLFETFATITDPTVEANSQWKFLDWICNSYLTAAANGQAISAEDLSKLRADLVDFETFKKRLPVEQRDIGAHENYDELLSNIRSYQQARDAKKAEELGATELVMRGTKVIYDGPEGKIIQPTREAASVFWGQQTRWCIAASQSKNYFYDYAKRGPVYMFLPVPSAQEKEVFADYKSFKFCGTGGYFYNEHDRVIGIMPPSLHRLFNAASFDQGAIQPYKREKKSLLRKIFSLNDGPLFQLGPLRPIAPADGSLWEDKQELMKAMRTSHLAYRFAAPTLRNDKDCALKAIKANQEMIKYVPEDVYQEDRDVAWHIFKTFNRGWVSSQFNKHTENIMHVTHIAMGLLAAYVAYHDPELMGEMGTTGKLLTSAFAGLMGGYIWGMFANIVSIPGSWLLSKLGTEAYLTAAHQRDHSEIIDSIKKYKEAEPSQVPAPQAP